MTLLTIDNAELGQLVQWMEADQWRVGVITDIYRQKPDDYIEIWIGDNWIIVDVTDSDQIYLTE